MAVNEFYKSIGVDPTEVLHRFGNNEAMLEKFLIKFLKDPSFVSLEEAMEISDWDAVFRAAHTLKGLSSNFDFKLLYELSAKIVEKYRATQFEEIPLLFEQLKVSYQTTIASLKENFVVL
ncbi:MAG: Hpt domain-containing protein [Anaeroplasmataceae bacterium]|nr:Hpt domain-containing protein [Anaeroplasmataceae bacterium]